jgi:hypothetical protein
MQGCEAGLQYPQYVFERRYMKHVHESNTFCQILLTILSQKHIAGIEVLPHILAWFNHSL